MRECCDKHTLITLSMRGKYIRLYILQTAAVNKRDAILFVYVHMHTCLFLYVCTGAMFAREGAQLVPNQYRCHFGSSEGSSEECGRRRASGAGATSHVHSWRRSSAAADPLKASCAADGSSLS